VDEVSGAETRQDKIRRAAVQDVLTLSGGAYTLGGADGPVYAQAACYEFCALPPGYPDREAWVLRVLHSGGEQWRIRRSGGKYLSPEGTWEQMWSGFPLLTALELARAHAPQVRVNGRNVADVLRADVEGGQADA
jgi:hypothetical protein